MLNKSIFGEGEKCDGDFGGGTCGKDPPGISLINGTAKREGVTPGSGQRQLASCC
jgi:hypothetical protein